MDKESLPRGQSRVFIIGFENFSFYYLPRRARIVSRRQAPTLDWKPGPNLLDSSAEDPVNPSGA